MATWADVRRVAESLPEVTPRAGDTMQWRVKDKLFIWERPLRKRDLEELGDAAPTGAVLAARVADEGDKEALVAASPDVYFTTSHFDGHRIVLVRLSRIGRRELRELVTDAWLDRAPRALVRQFRAGG